MKIHFIHMALIAGWFLQAGNVPVLAQRPSDEVPDGMEMIQVTNGYRMLVPKGAKVERIGGQVKVEDQGVVLIGKVDKLNERLAKIEEKIAELAENLKTVVKQQASLFSELEEKEKEIWEDRFQEDKDAATALERNLQNMKDQISRQITNSQAELQMQVEDLQKAVSQQQEKNSPKGLKKE